MAFRLAVLECDTPVPNVEKERGSYGAIFETLLSEGKSVDFRLLKYDVVRQHTYPSTGDVDGILITGSSCVPSAIPPSSGISCHGHPGVPWSLMLGMS